MEPGDPNYRQDCEYYQTPEGRVIRDNQLCFVIVVKYNTCKTSSATGQEDCKVVKREPKKDSEGRPIEGSVQQTIVILPKGTCRSTNTDPRVIVGRGDVWYGCPGCEALDTRVRIRCEPDTASKQRCRSAYARGLILQSDWQGPVLECVKRCPDSQNLDQGSWR